MSEIPSDLFHWARGLALNFAEKMKQNLKQSYPIVADLRAKLREQLFNEANRKALNFDYKPPKKRSYKQSQYLGAILKQAVRLAIVSTNPRTSATSLHQTGNSFARRHLLPGSSITPWQQHHSLAAASFPSSSHGIMTAPSTRPRLLLGDLTYIHISSCQPLLNDMSNSSRSFTRSRSSHSKKSNRTRIPATTATLAWKTTVLRTETMMPATAATFLILTEMTMEMTTMTMTMRLTALCSSERPKLQQRSPAKRNPPSPSAAMPVRSPPTSRNRVRQTMSSNPSNPNNPSKPRAPLLPVPQKHPTSPTSPTLMRRLMRATKALLTRRRRRMVSRHLVDHPELCLELVRNFRTRLPVRMDLEVQRERLRLA
jgi:hypothetical protein